MKHTETDFTYVDTMLDNRCKDQTMGRITPYDFSDLYLLMMNYWKIDEEREFYLLALTTEIEYLYNAINPNELPNQNNRNTRGSGRENLLSFHCIFC